MKKSIYFLTIAFAFCISFGALAQAEAPAGSLDSGVSNSQEPSAERVINEEGIKALPPSSPSFVAEEKNTETATTSSSRRDNEETIAPENEEAESLGNNTSSAKGTFVLPHVLEKAGITLFNADNDENAEMVAISEKQIGIGMKIDGASVRGWDAETKEAVRTRLEANDAKNDANDFGLFVAMKAIENKEVHDIAITEEPQEGKPVVSISYTASIKLFGIFKRNVPAVATIDASGKTKNTLTASLFTRLFSFGGDRSSYTDLARIIKTKHDTVKNSIGNIR